MRSCLPGSADENPPGISAGTPRIRIRLRNYLPGNRIRGCGCSHIRHPQVRITRGYTRHLVHKRTLGATMFSKDCTGLHTNHSQSYMALDRIQAASDVLYTIYNDSI